MLRRSTIVVVVVFVALLGIALYLQRNPLENSKSTNSTPTPAPGLFSWDAGAVSQLRISKGEGEALELANNGSGNWEITSQGPAESNKVSSAIAQLAATKILGKLDPVPALSVIGLEPPEKLITITLDDGQVLEIQVGVETPTKSGYYVRVGNGEPVVVYQYSLASVLDFLDNPPLSPTPTPSETNVPSALAETPFPPESPDSGTQSP